MARAGAATLIPLVLFAALAVGLIAGARGTADREAPGRIDRLLPSFSLPPMPGTEAGFSSADLAGKVVLVNVFASWCSVCRQEHPKLMDLAQQQNVPIYGINWKDSRGAGTLFLRRQGNPYVATGDDSAGTLGDQLDVTGVPETYVVDATGRVRYRHLGAVTDEVWTKVLQPLLIELEARS